MLLSLLLPRWSMAHEIRHKVSKADAVVVTLTYADGSPFALERYEIYRQGEEEPFRAGETDGAGQLMFLPDGEGEWRVKSFSQDGHGVEIRLTTDESSLVEVMDRPWVDRYPRLALGLGLIFGLFGILTLFFRRRR